MAESDSKTSSDETDRSDQNDEYSGLGRSYECTFCKRGFTTAQALGGHMNIHRKDRGKPRLDHKLVDELNNNIKYNNNNFSFRSFLAIQSNPPVHFARSSSAPNHHHQVRLDYQTYTNPATSTWGSTIAKPSVHNSQIDGGSIYRRLRGDWRIGSALSLGLGMSHLEEEGDEEEDQDHHDKEKVSGGDRVEVDLELRLGYDHP